MEQIVHMEYTMYKEPITDERWNLAQHGEKFGHIEKVVEQSYADFKINYGYYFEYLNIDNTDLKQKSIAEIGCARISSLFFCNNYSKSYVIEPTHYPEADKYYEGKDIVKIYERAEVCKFPKVDEVWMFNLLQHVQNPDLLIEKCKQNSKVIRFFEPIDYEINEQHPFKFSFDDFKNYFGDCVQLYHGRPGFHQANCAYGIYNCE
jgi:hypothetical protein